MILPIGARGIITPGVGFIHPYPATGPFGGHEELGSDVVSYWKFNETSGTTLEDIVGSNDGTLYNGTVNNSGLISKCIYLDGSGDYVSFGNNASLSADNMTWALWFKSPNTNNPTAYKGFLFKSPDTGINREIGIISNNSGGLIIVQIGDGSGLNYSVTNSTDIYDGNWHLIVCTKQKGASVHTVKLYIDADLIGTDNSASGFAVTNNSPLELGRIQTGATTYNAGYFDEMGIWSKALSQDAVTALYNSGNGLTY